MLPPFIIEQIRKREQEEERQRYQQPQLELPIPSPSRPRMDIPPDLDEPRRGVLILEF